MKKLFPLILAIIGLGVGTGTGVFLKPVEPENSLKSSEVSSLKENSKPITGSEKTSTTLKVSSNEDNSIEGHSFVKLNNQFVIPVVRGSKVGSLVVMSLSIEVASGTKDVVFSREPKLRDALLQVLFNHANSGGFDGAFTDGEKMSDLRGSLLEAAIKVLGPTTYSVLVIDLVKQDV